MGALKEAHGGGLNELYLPEGAAADARRRSRELPLVGPDRAPALRSRAAAERRLLAARAASWAAPTTSRVLARDAAGRRHPVADADHAGRHRGLRRRGSSRRDHRPARPEGVLLAILTSGRWEPDKRAEADHGLRRRRHRAPGRALPARPCRPRLSRRHGCRASSRRSTTTSSICATRRASCATASASSAGAGSSRSRPATRCTGRTRS